MMNLRSDWEFPLVSRCFARLDYNNWNFFKVHLPRLSKLIGVPYGIFASIIPISYVTLLLYVSDLDVDFQTNMTTFRQITLCIIYINIY